MNFIILFHRSITGALHDANNISPEMFVFLLLFLCGDSGLHSHVSLTTVNDIW